MKVNMQFLQQCTHIFNTSNYMIIYTIDNKSCRLDYNSYDNNTIT